MKNVLIAVNSFKETADAVKVSSLFNKYLDKSLFNVIQKPISDGGDGFLEVCKSYFRLETITYQISTPYNESLMDCNIGLDKRSKTVYIESAEVLGLKRIPPGERDPLRLSSKGLGDLLLQILQDVEELKMEVDKVVIGIGGTGTVDMGLGLCSVFGIRLFDINDSELEVLPERFNDVADIEFSAPVLPFTFEVILDVNNYLLGENGGIIYCAQKGASEGDLKIIESGWSRITNILKNNKLIDSPKTLPGAGGGLAVGLELLSKANLKHSKEFIFNDLEVIKSGYVDMVITGEGAFDEQSLMGKGAGIIINLFEGKNIPVVLCCGRIDSTVSENLSMNVFPVELSMFVNAPIKNFEEAIKIACDEISGMTDILTKIS